MILRKNGSIAKWAMALSALMLLTGCGLPPRAPASPSPTVTPVPSVSPSAARVLPTATWSLPTAAVPSSVETPLPPSATPVFPTLSPAQATLAALPKPPQPTPAHPIGGGTVTSGPFTFTLLLYRDEALSPTTNIGPWAYSDLPGVGWYADWVYHGPPIEEPIFELWGTDPDVSPRVGGYYTLRDGDHGGLAGGGVLLPAGVREGDPVRVVVKVQTPHGTYGAALVFVLRQGANGLEPTDIRVEAWR